MTGNEDGGNGSRPPRAGADELLAMVLSLREQLLRSEEASAEAIASVHPRHRAGARNLAHFLGLRDEDRRPLQHELAAAGLSSLGRSEGDVLGSVDTILDWLRLATGTARPEGSPCGGQVSHPEGGRGGAEVLADNARRLLGPAPAGRDTRILVTLPSAAAEDPELVSRFVAAGMDMARINLAHDGPDQWRAMAANVRAAATAAERPVRILADLGGPKLRTGPITPGPAVLKLRPRRDGLGRVLEPAQAMLVPLPDDDAVDGGHDPLGGEGDAPLPRIPVPASLAGRLEPGDVLRLRDARGSRRRLRVVAVGDDGVVVDTVKTTYLVPGTRLRARGHEGGVGPLPTTPGHLRLGVGDELRLTGDLAPVPLVERAGASAAHLGCTLPEAVAALEPGHRVWFDDGKLGGVVASVAPGEATVRITSAPAGGAKLRSEKGINLPDTTVPVPALSAEDSATLEVAVEVADVVALSFVREPADVEDLQRRLAELGAEHLGLLLKIETVPGFANLPDLVATAMRSADCGVMIARGDLAVEAGYERLAEVQEEILWLCEAAHLPAVWATEVLDRLARTGRPSRSEITDAAMAARAEGVMLNKGPHVTEAMATLVGILGRMADHQDKKRPLLRRLRSWPDHLGWRPRRT